MTPGQTGKALPNSPGRIRVSLRLREKIGFCLMLACPIGNTPKRTNTIYCVKKHPRKLTWLRNTNHLKTYLILKMLIFHCHINLLEGNSLDVCPFQPHQPQQSFTSPFFAVLPTKTSPPSSCPLPTHVGHFCPARHSGYRLGTHAVVFQINH